MSHPRRDQDYLADIHEAMQRIVHYTERLTPETFQEDFLRQDAVIRNLQVIGEATKKLSPEFRETHPEIPWREMAGMRDRIVHEYFGIRLDIIWNVTQSEFPALAAKIAALLEATAQATHLTPDNWERTERNPL